jgi:hypothetical protein
VIHADSQRQQQANVKECFQKLHDMIVEIAKREIPGTTPESQKKRVEALYDCQIPRMLEAYLYAKVRISDEGIERRRTKSVGCA